MDANGYLVPEPADPHSLICFRVYVPDHVWYVGAFWNAYEFFTHWVAWARDPLHRGLLAADVWRVAYARARAEFDNKQGVCMPDITDIRVDPLNPCGVQVQYDGDPSWITKLDLSCCGGSSGGGCSSVLRYNGSQMQQYNPQTQTWGPAGPVIVPNIDGPIRTPLTGIDNGTCLAARNAALKLEQNKTNGATALFDVDQLLSVITIMLSDWSDWVPGAIYFDGLFTILTGAVEYLSAHHMDIASLDITDDITCLLARYYSPDGSITQANFDAAMTAALLKTNTTVGPSTVTEGAWAFVVQSMFLYGPVGMSGISGLALVTDYDCSECGWEITLDFTVSPQGFVQSNTGNPHHVLFGNWVSGHGWTTERINLDGGVFAQGMELTRLSTPFHTNYVSMELEGTGVHAGPPGNRVVGMVSQYWANSFVVVEVDPVNDVHTVTNTPGDLYSTDSIWTLMGNFNLEYNPDVSETYTIRKITMRGNNPPPSW